MINFTTFTHAQISRTSLRRLLNVNDRYSMGSANRNPSVYGCTMRSTHSINFYNTVTPFVITVLLPYFITRFDCVARLFHGRVSDSEIWDVCYSKPRTGSYELQVANTMYIYIYYKFVSIRNWIKLIKLIYGHWNEYKI